MQIGMIGLGRMGTNMALRLIGAGHDVIGFDYDDETLGAFEEAGGRAVASLPALATALQPPRFSWLMLPQGDPVESSVDSLVPWLSAGDCVIDGGNSHYRDSQRRSQRLAEHAIAFLDVGTSGGVWGLRDGYCLMVGGEQSAYERLEPVFATLSGRQGNGYAYLGPSGAGHFAKMVHNGIEYGLMEAYAEGFALLAAKEEFAFDLAKVAETWRSGSVVRSWLLDLTANALSAEPRLESVAPYVEDTGEGRWALGEAIDLGVPLPAIAAALTTRFRSRQESPFAERMLAALRQQFGGHATRPS